MMNSFHKSIIYSVFGSLAAVGLLVSVTACKDDFDYRNNVGQPIAFTLSAPDAWHDGMSVNENAPTTRCTSVKALSGGDTKLYLHTVVADNPAEEKGAVTRGTPVRTFEKFKDIYPKFSLSGICYTGEYPTDENQNKWTANFAYNLLCNTDDGTPENTLLWPSNGNVRFFAFAPTLDKYKELVGNDGSLTLSDVSHEGSPTLTYTVPMDVTKQIDLMTACTTATGPTTPEVTLNFGHALTAVQIKCGEDMLAGKITEVSISGVYGSGTHVIGSKTWDTTHASTATYTIKKNINLPSKEGSDDIYHAAEGTPITGTETDNLTFMLIPQTLPEDATITITFTDSATDTERTLSGPIAGQEWEAGKIVTYTLSQSSINITPKIEFSKKPYTDDNNKGDSIAYSGVWYDATFTASAEIVQAGEENVAIETIPADKIKFYYIFDENAELNDDAWKQIDSKDIDDSGLMKIESQPHYLKFNQDQDETGSDTPTPLIYNGESANCYLVDQAGYYSLPLYYGNSYKEKKVAEGHANGLQYYPKHDNSAMPSDGKISEAKDAVLCWQDSPDLIDPASVKIVNDNLEFHIRKHTLAQGNALLAVRNASKEIIWSWHIWVTPKKTDFYTKRWTSKSGTYSYDLAAYNLGWCEPHATDQARKFKLKAVIDMSKYGGAKDAPVEIGTFRQIELRGSDAGDNTYYQWGRKDPMLGGIYNGTTPKYKYKKWDDKTNNYKSKLDEDEFTMENKQVFNQYKEGEYDYSFCKNPGDMIDKNRTDEASYGVKIGYTITHPYMFITNSRYNYIDEKVDFNYRNHWHIPFGTGVGHDKPPYLVKSSENSDTEAQIPIMFNAWNSGAVKDGETNTKVIKSVFDPCPPGFKIPPLGAFNQITKTNYKEDHLTYINNAWTIKNSKGEEITFPLTGIRNYALRPTEWTTVTPVSSVELFYKTSMPAFQMLTFISSATIVYRDEYNRYQVSLFRIDRTTRSVDPSYTNLTIGTVNSSNSYGLAVRPMHYEENTPTN